MSDNEPVPTVKAEAFASWGILETSDHTRLAGKVSDVELFGGRMCRIDVPLAEGKWLTRYYGLAAIFGLTPTDEAAARAVAASCRSQPVHAYEMPRLESSVPADPGEFAEVRREREEDYTDGPKSVEDDDPPY